MCAVIAFIKTSLYIYILWINFLFFVKYESKVIQSITHFLNSIILDLSAYIEYQTTLTLCKGYLLLPPRKSSPLIFVYFSRFCDFFLSKVFLSPEGWRVMVRIYKYTPIPSLIMTNLGECEDSRTEDHPLRRIWSW